MTSVSSETENVLLIEDDPITAALVVDFLGNDACSVYEADTCAKARQLIQEIPFSCAIVDLGLPDGNGLSLLPEIKAASPSCVTMILTMESRSASVVNAMRAGAFDYLIKPVDYNSVHAAVTRALEHHRALRDRDKFLALLAEEREQLARRVEEATKDLRQYADHIQAVNARQHSLLELARASSEYYTDENQFRRTFEEASKHAPVVCIALCSHSSREFIAVLRDAKNEIVVLPIELQLRNGATDALSLEALLEENVAIHTKLAPHRLQSFIFPLTFWGRTSCVVGFYLEQECFLQKECEGFLGACANILAMEWQEAQLFLHASAQGTLGSVAQELFKGISQGMTAIQMAAEVMHETPLSEDAREALGIILKNAEKTNKRIHEFRRLAAPQKGSVKTVSLPECIEQVLELVSLSIHHQKINVVRQYKDACECVVLNVEMLVRTLIDVLATVAALADAEGRIELRLEEKEPEEVVFEVDFQGKRAEWFDVAAMLGQSPTLDSRIGPAFLLAQRAIRHCAGQLSIDCGNGGTDWVFRITLPKNAMKHSPAIAGTRGL